MAAFFNTGLTQQQFIDEYWQKKPLLIRQGFEGFESPVSPEELAGLACEPEIESRLIQESFETGSWQVTHGPLTDEDFASLPESHWTLLVQDVDKHLADLTSLLDPFRFLPDWRRDDLMISYAVDQGSVGAHTDGYDVFLLQGMGRRHWQISSSPVSEPELLPEVELRILSHFEPNEDWVLEPGDILYLPPHFAHHGIAQGECMTFSIGFRAPKQVELLDALTNSLLEKGLAEQHYQDQQLSVTKYEHEIPQTIVANLKQLLHQAIDNADEVLLDAFGKLLTETKPSLRELASGFITEQPTSDEVSHQFSQGYVLQKNPYIRHAWASDNHGITLFISGDSHYLPLEFERVAIVLSESLSLSYQNWLEIVTSDALSQLVCRLIAEGIWYWHIDEN